MSTGAPLARRGARQRSEAKRRQAELARPVVRRLTRLLADVQKAAERSRIDSGAVSRADAHAAVGSLSAGIPARAKADGEAAAQVRGLGDEVMATAAGADLVPAGILADDFDERGGDASAFHDALAA